MELKPGHKQTEVGAIPSSWDVEQIKGVFRLLNGCAFKPEDWRDRGTPIVRIQNLNDPSAPFNYSTLPVQSRHQIDAGDLLFAWSGTTGTSFGARIWQGPSGVLNQHIFKVITNQERLTPEFAFYVLRRIQDAIEKQAHGFKSSFVHVKKSDLDKVFLPVPPLAEQRAIAGALSDVDALIAALDRLIAKKRDLKQAAMQQLLTGQTRLPGFQGQGEWTQTPLGELESRRALRLARGKVISKKDIARRPGDYAIYSSSVQAQGLFGRYGDFMFDEELITWSVDGGGHFFYRPKHRFSVTNVCGYMRVNTSVFSYPFLAAQLQHLHAGLRFDYQDKAHPSVIRKAYLLLLPPLDEQVAIAAALSDMDAEIAALEAHRDKTRMLKQGMMQELLTGRTRLI